MHISIPGPGSFGEDIRRQQRERDLTALVRRHHRQRQRQQRDFTKIIINKPPKCYTDSSSSNSTACSSPCHRKRFKHPVPNSKLMMPLLIKPSEAWRTEGIIIISFFFFVGSYFPPASLQPNKSKVCHRFSNFSVAALYRLFTKTI